MSVSTFTAGSKFVFRVIKHHSANPDRKWANTYELVSIADGSEVLLLEHGANLVEYEAAFHRSTTIFDRLIISTWEADSVPYDPSAFISSTLTLAGAISAGAEAVALNQVLVVARACAVGRAGHIFYRNCLTEEDVTAPAGASVLGNKPAMQSRIEGALTSSGFDADISAGAAAEMQLSLINKTGSNVRPVVNMVVQGVTNLPVDHAWFNRRSIHV